MPHTLDSLPLSNSFAQLDPRFYAQVVPTPFDSQPRLLHFNRAAAELLGLDPAVADDPRCAAVFSGAQPLQHAKPLAMLYAGHQFGQFVPQLGDGRAILLGETRHEEHGRWEIQLKGSGLTPFSRQGDGRAVLRSTIREYLCSEAMHALGIPTTRALCIVGSDDEVYRERIEPGAMLTRLAPSHVRFGSFEVFYYRGQFDAIRSLADYVISHHYPEFAELDAPQRYIAWLEEVIARTAALIAQWQAVGFCHGVMNSDNMSVLGLTLDYGPFGFMEAYDPGHVCNHSDYEARYAYDRQPGIGLFNLSCFAQAILPLLDEAPEQAAAIARERLDSYADQYVRDYARQMRAKLGLQTTHVTDQQLLDELLARMAADRVDFTIAFRRLGEFSTITETSPLRDLFLDREAFDAWAARYRQRLLAERSDDAERRARMHAVNPKFVLRNYLAEQAIRQAEDHNDMSGIDTLMRLLQAPYHEHPGYEAYADHPPAWAGQLSVSCSS